MSLVGERGMSDVSMVDVAKHAGIGRATLYKYFPGVEEIVAEFVMRSVRDRQDLLESVVADAADPVEAIRAFLSLLLQYFATTEHRSASAAVSPEQFSPQVGRDVHAAFAQVHELMAQLVVDAQLAGDLRDDIDPSFTARLLQQMLGAGRTAIVSGELDPDIATEQIMEQFLHGAGS